MFCEFKTKKRVLNMLDSQGSIDQPWVSMAKVANKHIDKNRLLDALLGELIADLNHFESNGFAPFAAQWQSVDALMGREVSIVMGEQRILGEYVGLNDKGELLLKTARGVESYNGGEVSLRRT